VTAATAPRLMTTEELLAMPDDGVRRWLINGQLREERPGPGGEQMTKRNRWHSRIMIRVGKFLDNWLDQQPEPRGEVLGDEAGVRLRRNPDTTVGIDVVYIAHEVAALTSADTTMIDVVPVLAVEILSPSTTQPDLDEKLATYRR